MLFISQISGHIFSGTGNFLRTSAKQTCPAVFISIGAFDGLLLCSCCTIPYKLLKPPSQKKIQSDWRLLRPLAVNALLWCQRLQKIRAIHNQKAFNSRNLPSWGIFQFPHRRGNRFLWAQCCRNFQLLIGGVSNFWIIWNIFQSLTS